jgi:hypothetical protein
MATMRVRFPVLLLTALLACRGTTAPDTVVTVTIFNRLDLAVSVSAGGTNYGSVSSGQSTVLTLPPRTTTVTWASAKRRYADGSLVPDDLNGASLSIPQNLGTLDITNIVAGVPYFTPRTSLSFNLWQSGDTLSYEVVQPTGRRCVGWQSHVAAASWGYYRLDAGTTFRVYAGASCVGNWGYWTYEQLSTYTAGSGVVVLGVTQVP